MARTTTEHAERGAAVERTADPQRAAAHIDAHSERAELKGREQIFCNPMLRYTHGDLIAVMDTLALEAPLEFFLDGKNVGRTMRTPGADMDLAAGMLFTTGRITSPEAIAQLRHEESKGAVHSFSEQEDFCSHELSRSQGAACSPAPSSPAAGQDSNAQQDVTTQRHRAARPAAPAELAQKLLRMRRMLEDKQRLYRHTGATHSAMFFDRSGAPISFGEDVGRHNAFDKCLGNALRQRRYHQAYHAVISSRLSHEIVSKAIRTGIVVLAGFSVATSLALELAQEHGITLVGRLRDYTMNMYSNERI